MKIYELSKHINFYESSKEFSVHLRKDAIVLSDLPLNNHSKDRIKVEQLFHGTKNELSDELADELLVENDTSYNPSRPFRWYRFMNNECAMTDDDGSSVKSYRKGSINRFLEKIDSPETFFITKLTLI